jgi:serine/threonine protein kinase
VNLVDQTITHEQEYRIDELVYDGSMNSIYRGQWKRLEQDIFISVLSGLDSLKLTRKAVQRIRNNLHENVGRVQHPNLPDVIDYGEGDQLAPFTIMRLPPGRLLVQRLEEQPLGTLETFKVIEDVAAALREARDAGLPHRGPTADRVWLTEDGRAILLGLGEVLYRHDSYSMSGPRKVDLIWHLPPEAFPHHGDEDGEADEPVVEPPDYRSQLGGRDAQAVEESEAAEVFALGALAYHCLSGHHPFFGSKTSPSSGIAALVANAKLQLEQRLVREPIEIALSPDPEERYPNVDEFVRELREKLRIPDKTTTPTAAPRGQTGKSATLDRFPEADSAPEESEDVDQYRAASVLWRGVAVLLFIALLVYAYLDLRRPTSIVITSDPPGIELTEVTGHLEENRGRTPIILKERNRNEDITVRALGPNGEKGPPVTVNPASLQDLGRCGRVHLDARFTERTSESSPSAVPSSPRDEQRNEPPSAPPGNEPRPEGDANE